MNRNQQLSYRRSGDDTNGLFLQLLFGFANIDAADAGGAGTHHNPEPSSCSKGQESLALTQEQIFIGQSLFQAEIVGRNVLRQDEVDVVCVKMAEPCRRAGQSGWRRLLSVTTAIEAGTCRQGDSGWA